MNSKRQDLDMVFSDEVEHERAQVQMGKDRIAWRDYRDGK